MFGKDLSWKSPLASFICDLICDMEFRPHLFFIDFIEALDNISHSRLLTMLSPVNLSPKASPSIHVFLTNRLQYRFVINRLSNSSYL